MSNFKNLLIWQKSIDFVNEIYKLTSKFPKEEIYGLTSQLKRSSISVPSNIAEGSCNRTTKEFDRFLTMALGSSYEVETQLIISLNQNFITKEHFNELNIKINEIQKMISSFKKTLI